MWIFISRVPAFHYVVLTGTVSAHVMLNITGLGEPAGPAVWVCPYAVTRSNDRH